MARLRYNGLSSALGAALTDSATAVTFDAALTHSGGTAVPTISGGDVIPLSLLDGDGRLKEVVNLTAYTSGTTTGTITRGQSGTAAAAHDNGARIVHSPLGEDIVRAPIFTMVDTPAGVHSGSIPAGMVDVPGMSLVIPAGNWLVSGYISAASHVARCRLLRVSDSSTFHTEGGFIQQGDAIIRIHQFFETPLTVASGTETIKAQWAARDTTSGMNIYRKFLLAQPY